MRVRVRVGVGVRVRVIFVGLALASYLVDRAVRIEALGAPGSG